MRTPINQAVAVCAWRIFLSLVLGVCAVDACSCLQAATYEFDLVARQFEVVDGQELDFFRGVSLDDQGSVAFTAVALDDDTQELTGAALLIDNQRVVGTGDMIASGQLGFLGKPYLSSDGTVSYSADVFPQGSGLSNTGAIVGDRSDLASQILLAGRDSSVGGIVLDGALDPAINDFGSLAYTGVYFDDNLGINATAMVHDDTVIAATGDLIGNFVIDTVDQATINNAGDLAFTITLLNLTTTQPAYAIVSNGLITAVDGATTDGITLTDVFAPALNELGDLAYVGEYFDASMGLHNTTILVNGQSVIRSGNTSVEGLIIDTIEDVSMNSAGQLAFQATFIDPNSGTFFEQGIFLTRVIPEPTSVGLLVVAFMVLTARTRL